VVIVNGTSKVREEVGGGEGRNKFQSNKPKFEPFTPDYTITYVGVVIETRESKPPSTALCYCLITPIPVATWSKARVCGGSVFGIAGSNPAKRHGCLSLMSVVCCQVQVSASGRSHVQRIPTEYGVSERDREASIKRRPWPTKGC